MFVAVAVAGGGPVGVVVGVFVGVAVVVFVGVGPSDAVGVGVGVRVGVFVNVLVGVHAHAVDVADGVAMLVGVAVGVLVGVLVPTLSMTLVVIVDAKLFVSSLSFQLFSGSTTTLLPRLVNPPNATGVSTTFNIAVPVVPFAEETQPPVKNTPFASAVPL